MHSYNHLNDGFYVNAIKTCSMTFDITAYML